ncbi:MAG: efflux RND transporter periplasmic adaptor subunit [Candidatus Brocadia sp.]|jgi:cobalt-zinc-cadmium efflux system membrane fusion protein
MKKELFFIASVLTLLPWSASCGRMVEAKKNEEHIDVKTCKVISQEIQTFIEAVGSIQGDIEGMANIVSPLDGIVDRIFVRVGDRVRKGESLIAIRSSNASDIYANYLTIQSQLRLAERSYNLSKELNQFGAITKNDLINTEANYEQLKAVEEGFRKKLEICGIDFINKSSYQDRLILKTPIDGVVANVQTHIGERVDTATFLMTVADPNKVLVIADVYDTDMKKIRNGSEVVFFTDIFPDREFKGIVTYVSDIVSTASKTVKTYIQVLNSENLFKINMFLKIKIADGKMPCQVIPKSSLLYKNGKFHAYVKGDGEYRLKEIRPIREVSEKLMAVEGLAGIDEIVLAAIDMEKI